MCDVQFCEGVTFLPRKEVQTLNSPHLLIPRGSNSVCKFAMRVDCVSLNFDMCDSTLPMQSEGPFMKPGREELSRNHSLTDHTPIVRQRCCMEPLIPSSGSQLVQGTLLFCKLAVSGRLVRSRCPGHCLPSRSPTTLRSYFWLFWYY